MNEEIVEETFEHIHSNIEYHPYKKHVGKNVYYPASCSECGWSACSCQLKGGKLTRTGYKEVLRCPECGSTEV